MKSQFVFDSKCISDIKKIRLRLAFIILVDDFWTLTVLLVGVYLANDEGDCDCDDGDDGDDDGFIERMSIFVQINI